MEIDNKKVKRIGIMIGSDSDLSQCFSGLLHLEKKQGLGKCEVVVVITNSIHRNTEEVLKNLKTYSHQLDAWIIGAGWANHLTGTCEAYLRYTLKNNKTRVFGVAFEDVYEQTHTLAAVLSILIVPGTQVNYCGQGSEGFLMACKNAVGSYDKLPEIKIVAGKTVVERNLEQAIETVSQKMNEGGK